MYQTFVKKKPHPLQKKKKKMMLTTYAVIVGTCERGFFSSERKRLNFKRKKNSINLLLKISYDISDKIK